ncbi:magnesium/cobalt transporter CorA [Entomospira culicis]|uniref:Magnesium transport protein CorA n=1 Tax=Entomospira culicis TaxID=2719989 RepID=A0A968GK55_9SPIO|nr:magnesium/cobalt transporter CorA [Entomospira culicis]NIZ19126.1 magnesium/cobalt transporter CorA [Entomospira culicis]NIZ69340.1 magnesium/cobalt transporter CorA [Entomospira culicis]WDI37926.1 magnesium/cobalt transporter CorA [Entomospira culicis]WDI39553.1 magnesium/cobalt transporter CorA [Entomospira culicis]
MKKRKIRRKRVIIKTEQSLHVSPSLVVDASDIQGKNEYSLIRYDSNMNAFEELTIASEDLLIAQVQRLHTLKMEKPLQDFVWVDVRGMQSNEALIKRLSTLFPLDPMTQDNLTDATLRTKLEDFDDYGFLTLQAFYQFSKKSDVARSFEHAKVSILINNWLLLTLQHSEYDIFASQKKRILSSFRKILPRIRTDFLLYFLLDTLVDQYFTLMDVLSDEIEHLSNLLFRSYSSDLIEHMYTFNQYLFLIRHEVVPLSEVLLLLRNGLMTFEDDQSSKYFANVGDHVLKLVENLNFHRDSLNNLMNLYYSLSDQKLNQIMKTLTVVSTVFIPLTFIVGVYGMNFAKMPELEWQYGYIAVWGLMITVGVGITLYMKKKKWI